MTMSSTTGTGIALLVIGAILSFAVRDMISGVNLTMIGYICMGAGVLAIILGLVTNAQATRRTNVVEHRRDDI
jgi:tellurite resistance protein TehA-like permease